MNRIAHLIISYWRDLLTLCLGVGFVLFIWSSLSSPDDTFSLTDAFDLNRAIELGLQDGNSLMELTELPLKLIDRTSLSNESISSTLSSLIRTDSDSLLSKLRYRAILSLTLGMFCFGIVCGIMNKRLLSILFVFGLFLMGLTGSLFMPTIFRTLLPYGFGYLILMTGYQMLSVVTGNLLGNEILSWILRQKASFHRSQGADSQIKDIVENEADYQVS